MTKQNIYLPLFVMFVSSSSTKHADFMADLYANVHDFPRIDWLYEDWPLARNVLRVELDLPKRKLRSAACAQR